MGTELVGYEIKDSAAVLTPNSPRTRNALSMPMVDAILTCGYRKPNPE